jgi:hypothetical protein
MKKMLHELFRLSLDMHQKLLKFCLDIRGYVDGFEYETSVITSSKDISRRVLASFRFALDRACHFLPT